MLALATSVGPCCTKHDTVIQSLTQQGQISNKAQTWLSNPGQTPNSGLLPLPGYESEQLGLTFSPTLVLQTAASLT